jgi:hypothetical protein
MLETVANTVIWLQWRNGLQRQTRPSANIKTRFKGVKILAEDEGLLVYSAV